MNCPANKHLFFLSSLFILCSFLYSCVPTQPVVSGAADVDTTAAACVFVAKELDRKTPLKGLSIQIVEENIQESETKVLLPYSRILTDGLTRELSNQGAVVSVREDGNKPLVLHASYSRANDVIIIDVKLRQVDYDHGTTKELAIAEAAIPAKSLAPHWLEPTMGSLADALIRQLGENYVSGDFIKLKIVKSVPGNTGQPSLVLGRSYDGALQEAASRIQALPVSITSQKEVLLRSSYALSGNTIHFKAWLEDKSGKQLATAITSMNKSGVSADMLTPMANDTVTACMRYERRHSDDPPVTSMEAAQLQKILRNYMQDLGIKTIPCSISTSSLPQVIAAVALPPLQSTKDGYNLTTAQIIVKIVDNQGREIGSFQNQASRGYSHNRSKANTKAIDKAASTGLKKQLAKSLLSVAP